MLIYPIIFGHLKKGEPYEKTNHIKCAVILTHDSDVTILKGKASVKNGSQLRTLQLVLMHQWTHLYGMQISLTNCHQTIRLWTPDYYTYMVAFPKFLVLHFQFIGTKGSSHVPAWQCPSAKVMTMHFKQGPWSQGLSRLVWKKLSFFHSPVSDLHSSNMEHCHGTWQWVL